MCELPVTFARPRSVITLKSDPQFGAMVAEIWDALGAEVMRAKERELRG